MDGHFVPNIVLGAPILSSVKKAVPGIFMDVSRGATIDLTLLVLTSLLRYAVSYDGHRTWSCECRFGEPNLKDDS